MLCLLSCFNTSFIKKNYKKSSVTAGNLTLPSKFNLTQFKSHFHLVYKYTVLSLCNLHLCLPLG